MCLVNSVGYVLIILFRHQFPGQKATDIKLKVNLVTFCYRRLMFCFLLSAWWTAPRLSFVGYNEPNVNNSFIASTVFPLHET